MSSQGKLSGKVALVTGASKGIGAEIARRLGADGAAVVVNYASSRTGADAVVADIKKSGGKAVAIQGDVSKEDDAKRLFDEAEKALGKLDILVNNAGVFEFAPIEEFTVASYRRMYDVNVLGLLLSIREGLKHFNPKGGSIINIGSLAATSAPATGSVYSGTKGALDTITMAVAKEVGPKGIRVNAVNPGMVETEGARTLGVIDSDWAKQVAASAPLRRIGQPSDIASVVSFMAGDDSGWLTGQLIIASGGDR